MQRIGCFRMRRRRALCSNFRRGARKADVELEGRQSDSHAAGAKNVRVCVAEERPIASRYKTQRLRSGCPCRHLGDLEESFQVTFGSLSPKMTGASKKSIERGLRPLMIACR